MLCYAWDRLDEQHKVDLSIADQTSLLNLLAKVLISSTRTLLKRGLDRDYQQQADEILGVKGKLDMAETLKRNLLFKQKTQCVLDDFSANMLLNQVLASTLHRLTRTQGIEQTLKTELHTLLDRFFGVERIEIQRNHFRQVHVNRNNQRYGFVLDVCRLIFENSFPSEEAGRYSFSDFRRDESKMRDLFEAFVRNFYRIEQRIYPVVKKEVIRWQFKSANESNRRFLPRMETDITLESNDRKIIIDTKYYQKTLVTRFDQGKIYSSNLYQLFSYLINQEDGTEKTMTARGILLYPTVEEELNLVYEFGEHVLEIKTVDLNSDWAIISARLKEILP